MDKNNNPLKVALHAMEERSCKVMIMYLQGPCQGAAVVVDKSEAEVDIFDIDAMNAMKLLNEHLAKKPQRPIIALSLHDGNLKDILYVKKPVKTDNMLAVLNQARLLLNQRAALANSNKPEQSTTEPEKPALKKYVIDSDEQKKTAKHEAAMQLNEKGFGAFIGNVSGLDVNDPKQFSQATYNPKEYFQGYVESAFKASHADGQAKQLNSGWSPLLIFPQNDEIWLDADDKQLRAFAGLTINNMAGAQISITSLSAEAVSAKRALEKFQSMDAFIWKLACWASKGRYPVGIDIERPIFLKNWPNFTRLLITPHAMRISALLIQQPRTLSDIARVLNIKPQYVFVFISSAYALNLAGQAKREADILVQPPAEIKPNKNQGFLGRIMNKLRS